MPTLRNDDISQTLRPLTQFLNADREGKLSICDFYDDEDNKGSRLTRIQTMLSNADISELDSLQGFVTSADRPNSGFVACLKRGINVKRMLLNLPGSSTPHIDIIRCNEGNVDSIIEFGALFNQFDQKDAGAIASLTIKSFETLNEASKFVRIMERIKHSKMTGQCLFVSSLEGALQARVKAEAPSFRRPMFARQPATPETQATKEETAGLTP